MTPRRQGLSRGVREYARLLRRRTATSSEGHDARTRLHREAQPLTAHAPGIEPTRAESEESSDAAVGRLASSVAEHVFGSGDYARSFRLWEAAGFHVTPVHFYFPIPDTRSLPERLWASQSELIGIDLNVDAQLELVREAFPRFRAEYETFPREPTERPHEYYFDNPQFGGTDALALYCMVRHFEPKLIVEVGSGFSSLVAARAALQNGETQLVCIDPYHDGTVRHENLRQGFPGLTSLVTEKVEDLDVSFFDRLGPGDILFIDTSHVARIGGDVTYLLLEVVPRLEPGVLVHVHDIFLPFEYPREWVVDLQRFWNEQYLLHAFLAFNREFEVVLANHYLGRCHRDVLVETFPNSPWWGGGSFWIRRTPPR